MTRVDIAPRILPPRESQPLAGPVAGQRSPELAQELNRLETAEQADRDRRAQEELARLRELARFD